MYHEVICALFVICFCSVLALCIIMLLRRINKNGFYFMHIESIKKDENTLSNALRVT
jgi:hypothetical protein